MVNDLYHTHRKKLKLAPPISISHDNFSDTLSPFSDNQTSSINNSNGITSLPAFYTKRSNKFRLTKLKLFPKRQPLSQPTINYRTFSFLPYKNKIQLFPTILLPIQFNLTVIHIHMTI